MWVKVPLASSGLRSADIESVLRVLNSGKLTMGQEVKNFEDKMARYLGVNHFVMVNSGSSANLLMIEALMRPTLSRPRLNPGDSVLVPAVAWPTTIWPLIQLGLNPLFVDVDLKTLAIDLDAAQLLIDTSRIPVKGIFPIHPLGKSINPSLLSEFSDKNDLVLINDVCESLGSWSEGKHAGTAGVAGSFSFYFSHHITTMEGGGISTNSDEYADDLRSMRSHGWSRDRSDVNSWIQKKSSNDSKFLFVSTGYNVRPMEIQAAIGSNQIELIDTFISRRREIAKRVHEHLSKGKLKIIGSEALTEDPQSHSWMLIPLLVLGKDAPKRRNQMVRELEDLGIETLTVLTGILVLHT
jgi:CDP-6-deoxy-D-xylo-4-hexulose-3-dehydrase